MKTKTTKHLKNWFFIPIFLMSLMLSAQGTILEDICAGTPIAPVLTESIASYPLTDLSDANGNNNTEIIPGVNISDINGLCLDNSILDNFDNIGAAISDPDFLSIVDSFDVTPIEDNFDPNNFGIKLEFNLSYSPSIDVDSEGVVVLPGTSENPYLDFLGIVYNYVTEQVGILLEDGSILYAEVDVPLNQWHTIEVKHLLGQGGFVYLNGEIVLAVNTIAIDFDEVEIDFSQFDVSNLSIEGALDFVTSFASIADGYKFCLRNIEVYKCVPGAIEVPSVTENCSVSLDAPLAWDICSGTVVATTTDPTEYIVAGDYVVNWSFVSANGLGELILPQTVTVSTDTYTWTGNVNSDWENTGNWQDALAPGLMMSSSAIIPAGMPNHPVLTAGQELYINECSTVNIDSGASLTVNPNAVVSNDGTVTNNGMLTFESDTSGSAYIGQGSGVFNGDATIERFIPARRAFRFLSSPVTTDDFIANNWQQDTHITGSTVGANGFDITNTGNPSMFSYDNVNQSWNAIPNTDATNLETGVPYRLMVRGDRTVDLSDNDATPSPTTLMVIGELTAENAALAAVALNASAGGFSFIGNPFQAQVNMQSVLSVNSTNVNPSFYWAWDPNLGIRGAYATVILPAGISTAGDANENLQAGQACFVQTNAASAASITFTQSSKVTSEAETNVFKSSGKKNTTASTGQLNLKLYESNSYAANEAEADGLWVFFDDDGNNGVDGYDAIDFTNLDENFATNNSGTLLSVENRATPTVADEIVLEINTYRNTDYVIVATASALQGDIPILLDTYLDQSTEIPQSGTVAYNYIINAAIPASYAGDRFKIIFENSVPLSVEENELSQIMLYPNPSKTGNFYLNIPQGIDDLEVSIYNTLGARVFNEKEFSAGREVSINAKFNVSNGVYFVKLASKSKGLTTSKKLIINK